MKKSISFEPPFKPGDTVICDSPSDLGSAEGLEGVVSVVTKVYPTDDGKYWALDTNHPDGEGWFASRFRLHGESVVDRILIKYQHEM